MPDEELRRSLWLGMLPAKWLKNGKEDLTEELIALAAKEELSGGSITNVVRRCALRLIMSGKETLDARMLKEALEKEKSKT